MAPVTLSLSSAVAIDKVLQGAISFDPEQVDSLAALHYGVVNKEGDIIYKGLAGEKTEGVGPPVYAIASGTKLATALSVLHLLSSKFPHVEPLSILNDSSIVDEYLPELKSWKIARLIVKSYPRGDEITGEEDSEQEREQEEKEVLELITRGDTKISPKMLLNQSAGFSYPYGNWALWENLKKEAMEEGREVETFEDDIGATFILKTPMVSEPGIKWSYGLGYDWAGTLLERISGLKLGDYMEKHLFQPLGIKDTAFDLRPDMRERLLSLYSRDSEGKLHPRVHLKSTRREKNTFQSGGAGLFSTLPDYLTLLTVVLNSGIGKHQSTKDSVTILSKEWATFLSADTLEPHQKASMREEKPELGKKGTTTPRPDLSNVVPSPDGDVTWGFGGLVMMDPLPTGRKGGSLTWSGLTNVYWHADIETGIGTFCVTQLLPFWDTPTITTQMNMETELYKGLK